MEIEIVVDEEIESLIPKLSPEEFSQLEDSICNEGCREPVVVWKGRGILLDGHHRLAVCKKHGLQCRAVEIELPDRDAAKIWVLRNQLGRRNLNNWQRAELALKLEPLMEDKAWEQTMTGKGAYPVHIPQGSRPSDIVAKMAGLSRGTIRKAKALSKNAPPETIDKLAKSETSISRAYRDFRRRQKRLSSASGGKPEAGPCADIPTLADLEKKAGPLTMSLQDFYYGHRECDIILSPDHQRHLRGICESLQSTIASVHALVSEEPEDLPSAADPQPIEAQGTMGHSEYDLLEQ